jgi:CHRD domain
MRTHVRTALAVVLAASMASLLFVGQSVAGVPTTTVLAASLSGAEEVPGPGDDNGTGTATITLDPSTDTVCFELHWQQIRAPFAAHIHRGATGVAGPVKVPLFVAEVPLPTTIKGVDGCVRGVDSDLIDRIIANPQNFYVNIHNRQFPDGAMRGQLAPAP